MCFVFFLGCLQAICESKNGDADIRGVSVFGVFRSSKFLLASVTESPPVCSHRSISVAVLDADSHQLLADPPDYVKVDFCPPWENESQTLASSVFISVWHVCCYPQWSDAWRWCSPGHRWSSWRQDPKGWWDSSTWMSIVPASAGSLHARVKRLRVSTRTHTL